MVVIWNHGKISTAYTHPLALKYTKKLGHPCMYNIYNIVKRTTKKHVQTEQSIMRSFSLECLAQEGRSYQSNHATSVQKAVFSGATHIINVHIHKNPMD